MFLYILFKSLFNKSGLQLHPMALFEFLFQNFYAYMPWIAAAPKYKCTKFKAVCLQITMISTMSLLPMKQSFYKAMCTCIAMGVLTPN